MHPSLEARLGAITFGAPLPPPQEPAPAPSETTAALNRLLRQELAAIEAYERAGRMIEGCHYRAELRTVQEGHRRRSDALHVLLLARHAQPAAGPGVWGVVVLVAESTAGWLGVRMVLATLHELEQRSVANYRRELPHVDELTRTQVEAELLPAQENSLAIITGLSAHPSEDPA